MFVNFFLWPRKLLVWLIKIYQQTLSFDHGPLKVLYPHGFCRFYPTCSEYGKEAIGRFGIIKGGMMTAGRIFRCNPWNKGGYDPVEHDPTEEARNNKKINKKI